jgi:hypothetical protein
MITVKDFAEAIEHKITGGSEYGWDCFGPNARYLDCDDSEGCDGAYSINAVFDSRTQQVYIVEVWDYANDREYRWIDKAYVKDHMKACAKHNVDLYESMDGRNYIDLDVEEDILEKANALVNGVEYDTRVKVPVDFSDEDLLHYMKLAHELDITFNELVERALKEAITELETDPEAFKQRAERFKNENYPSI